VKQERALSIYCRPVPRILFCTLLLAILFPRWSPAEEFISGVLAFDPPAFLSAGTFGRDSTNSADGIPKVWHYAATDNDPRTSQRLLIVSIRETGAVLDSEKAVTNRGLDDTALRAEMQAAMNSIRNATNVSAVTDAEVGGQAALLASYQLPRPYWQKSEGSLCPCEVYWIRVQTNQVAEIKLIADSTEHLETLKSCLPKFKITKTDGMTATK
jgi:hypothetical protein